MNFYRTLPRSISRHGYNLMIKRWSKAYCLETWSCKVPPVHQMEGTVSVRTKYAVNIAPLHLHNNSVNNAEEEALVSLNVNTEKGDIKRTIKEHLQYIKCDFQIESGEHTKSCKVSINALGEIFSVNPKDISLEVRVPYHFSVIVNSEEHADVHIKNMEGKKYEVSTTGTGNCNLNSLKGQSINCEAYSGDIKCESYLLSKYGCLVSKKGNIYVNKLQGGNFILKTKQGREMNVKAVYLEKIKLESEIGIIKLGDIHGIAEVLTDEGNLTIGSVKGNLHASTKTGNIDAFILEHENVELKTDKGNIMIKMENSTSSDLTVEAESIHIDSSLNLKDKFFEKENGNQSVTRLTAQLLEADNPSCPGVMKVKARFGQVKIEKMDWFTSLKLNV